MGCTIVSFIRAIRACSQSCWLTAAVNIKTTANCCGYLHTSRTLAKLRACRTLAKLRRFCKQGKKTGANKKKVLMWQGKKQALIKKGSEKTGANKKKGANVAREKNRR